MSEPNEQDTNKADEIVSKWDCSVSENESDGSLALLSDAIASAIADERRRGQSDMAVKASEVCRSIADDHGGQYTDSGDVAMECAKGILALSLDPNYAATLRDELVEKVKAQPRFSVVSGEFEERSNGEFIDRDDVLQILEKE